MPQATKKPLIVVTRKLPDVVETRMRELFDAKLNVDDHPMTQAELVEAAKSADVLVPTVTDRIDRGVISQAGPQLRLIANFGTGASISTRRATAPSPSPTHPACSPRTPPT
jgi:glyoxylate reductase